MIPIARCDLEPQHRTFWIVVNLRDEPCTPVRQLPNDLAST